MPLAVYGQEGAGSPPASTQNAYGVHTPPVEQALVPEGVFAVQLAQALKVGKVQEEAQAEDMLSAKGIEPRNGWIGGYPVTPDIIAEIRNSVAVAADGKKLEMGKDEALKAVDGVVTGFGLNVRMGNAQAASGIAGQISLPSAVIDDYYYDYGPPVVTYYPPPWDYDYLYGWVPFPFWCDGFFFGGFFVLHDFHRHVHFHNHLWAVTNHAVNAATNRVSVVDPVTRTLRAGPEVAGAHPERAFSSPRLQSSARSIVARSESRSSGLGMSGSPQRNLQGGSPSRSETSHFQDLNQPRGESGISRGNEARGPNSNGFGERSSGLAPSWSSHSAPSSPGHFSSAPSMHSGGFSGGFHGSAPSSGGFHGGGGSFGGFHGGGGGHGGGGHR